MTLVTKGKTTFEGADMVTQELMDTRVADLQHDAAQAAVQRLARAGRRAERRRVRRGH
jgi:hypothetical protein